LSPEAAAALLYRPVGVGLVAGLPVPCSAARHAHPSDRHRPVQIRRIQAQRTDPGDAQPGLLKPGRPYLDAVEWPIVPSVATRILGFIADKFDSVYGVTIPLLQDVRAQAPQAVCEVIPTNVPRTLLVNPAAPPLDNPELRRAMALTLDRKAFIDILTLGQGDVGGAMLPAPEGVWGMPAEMLRALPGYDPDVAKNRAEARRIMENLGYGPSKRLAVKVSVRNIAPARDPAVILVDHLKEIYIDGEL